MEISKSNKTAVVLGSTGLVGRQLTEELLAHPAYREVRVIVRRADKRKHPKLKARVVDFDRLEDYADAFAGDDVFIALGTTRAEAGSPDAFRKVDYDYVVHAAALASRKGCRQCVLVSSVGADPNSALLYPQTKGRAEQTLAGMEFWALHILRPSVLLGKRDSFRLGEKMAAYVLRGVDALAGGILGGYRPVEAATVARAMVRFAQGLEGGVFHHPSDEIKRIGGE